MSSSKSIGMRENFFLPLMCLICGLVHTLITRQRKKNVVYLIRARGSHEGDGEGGGRLLHIFVVANMLFDCQSLGFVQLMPGMAIHLHFTAYVFYRCHLIRAISFFGLCVSIANAICTIESNGVMCIRAARVHSMHCIPSE